MQKENLQILKELKQIFYLQIKQLVYSNAQTAGGYAVNNFYLKSTIRLKTLVNNSFLKVKMTCDSRNLIYVVICPTCKEENIGETGIGNSKLRDWVRKYRQHIRQPFLYKEI